VVEFERVLTDIVERDERDQNRAIAPLRPADDAIVLDTTNMTIVEVVDYIENEARVRNLV
jgi:cytidylate kinase